MREKVFRDLLQNFTEQLIYSYWSDAICHSASLIQGQNFADPKCCVISNLLLQQIAGLRSSKTPPLCKTWSNVYCRASYFA